MNDERPRVAVIGPLNMDMFMRGAAPLERDQLNVWVGPSDVDLLVAGSIGYTVQVFAKLGWHVDVCSSVGSDAFGLAIRHELEQRGLDCRYLADADGVTAIAIYVMLFGGIKRPMTYRLPSFEPWPDPPPDLWADEPGAAPLSVLHSGGLLHFPDMWHRGQAELFTQARAHGILTSIDPQFPLTDRSAPWLPHIADVIREADVLLCDEHEAKMLFEEDTLPTLVSAAHAAGPRHVAIKLGGAGAVASDGTTLYRQPAAKIDPALVREAVGAGDAFDAGFLDALSRGVDVASAARFATAAATASLSGRGGAESIAGRAEIEQALELVPAGEQLSTNAAG